jgi:hypothetical protein
MTDFFDSEADFQVYRRKLPHWRQAGVTYFVTFRLASRFVAHTKTCDLERGEKTLARPKPASPQGKPN